MEIELKNIPISDLVEGYQDNNEEGVVGYGGKLNIRPPYQREFVYKDPQQKAVIDTVLKGFPLNTIYWAKTEDGNFELLDGQQRIVSICKYVNNDFSISIDGDLYLFCNLPSDIKEKLLSYRLTVYICEGTDSEKLAWFKTINIAGEKLTDQELRNAVYAGPWLTDAKRRFSKTGCIASELSSDCVSANTIRQELLEKAIGWMQKDKSDEAICEYMAKNQFALDSNELWDYFKKVIEWVKANFTVRKELKSVELGFLYNEYKNNELDANALEDEISKLMQDDEVIKKSGIYEYVLSGDEKHLNLRAFPNGMKREVYEAQKGVCPYCNKKFEFEKMEADHKYPWSQGGKTIKENCQMLCRDCNLKKSNK